MIPKRYKTSAVRLMILTAICSTVYANVPNTDNHPSTFLGPIASLSYTAPLMSSDMAYTLLGEGGPKHFRVNGTFGFELDDYNRFKISAEYLTQDIKYAFFSGDASKWVDQLAVGAGLQQDINLSYSPQFDISGYYSYAPNKKLSTVNGTYINSSGMLLNFADVRRIAGSNAGGGEAGLSINPWWGARTGLSLNYDSVHYDTSSTGVNEDAVGFGGTAFYNQNLTDHLMLGLIGAVRQPFNNYQLNLVWNNLYIYSGNWSIGAFGEYTEGKNTLPNTWNAGINLNYIADRGLVSVSPAKLSYTNEVPAAASNQANNFMQWVSKPAVYMPQVLAIVDPMQACAGAVLTSPFPNIVFPIQDDHRIEPINVAAASHFSGTDLTFSFVSAPTGLSIDPKTGVISGSLEISSLIIYTVVVRAANNCGVATGSFRISEA